LKQANREPVRCPHCSAADVRKSAIGQSSDYLMSMFSFLPLRCQSCGYRFYRRLPEQEGAEESRRDRS